MEQRECGGSKNCVLDFECENVVPRDEKSVFSSATHMQKKGVIKKQTLNTVIPSQTPVKTSEPLKGKSEKTEIRHLDKCKTLSELFDSMVCSLRLLSLSRKQPTFESIRTQVEILTKRKLSYRHLAQIKYILPEAIHIEVGKICKQDKKVVHVKPEMIITLLFEVIEIQSEQSKYSLLCEVFASRLTNFYDMHPEAYDIPEARLPEPFTYVDQNITPDHSPGESVGQSQSTTCEIEQPFQASHLSPSFKRHFSQNAAVIKTEDSEVCASLSSLPSSRSGNSDNKNDGIGPLAEVFELHPKSDCVSEQNNISKEHEESITVESSISSAGFRNLDSPQVKDASAIAALSVQTPVQLTPRRSISSSDNEKRVTPQASSVKPAKRFLNFTALEEDECSLDLDEPKCYADTAGIATDSSKPPQKVERSHNYLCNDGMVMQTKVAYQQSSICEPDLVAIICHVFQSVYSSSITKGELVHKIIMNSLDIIGKREVEEHIELLERVAPDFICRRLAPTGDIMYSILKTADLDSVRKRINST